jgi:mediator of replication checkpoint protein 1
LTNELYEQPDIRNYADVSWIDQRDEETDLDPVDVHIVPPNVKKSTVIASIAKPIAEWDSFMMKVCIYSPLSVYSSPLLGPSDSLFLFVVLQGGVHRKESAKDLERSRAWAKNETRNMTGSTGRLVGGIAVTGLGTRAKDGGSLLGPKAPTSSISASVGGKKSLRAESSVLAGIAKRKEQFQ